MNCARRLFTILIMALSGQASAAQIEVLRSSNIYSEADRGSEILEQAKRGDRYALASPTSEEGYFKIALKTRGEYGWIYRNRIRIIARQIEPEETSEEERESLAAPATATTEMCLLGCPAGGKGNRLVTRSIYVLSNNAKTKFADWVAYRIDASMLGGESGDRKWKADPLLPADETLEPEDYEGANKKLAVDRGHQAPLASFSKTGHAAETNYLSNITPQKSALNQGPWVRLETKEREMARNHLIYVTTGPLYQKGMPKLPGADEDHEVPSGYWKAIAAVDKAGSVHVAGFVMNQDLARDADYADQVVTVDHIEQASGLDLFWQLDDSAEETLESELDINWMEELSGSASVAKANGW